MINSNFQILFFIFSAFFQNVLGAPQAATKLLTDYQQSNEAILIDATFAPRFSWLPFSTDRGVTQSAYRIVVTRVTEPSTQMWDSGTIASSQMSHVSYAGAALASDEVYSWTVTWTDSNNVVAPASSPAFFATGLLTQQEWTQASWIGCPLHGNGNPNYNQIRAEFDIAAPDGVTILQARAYVTAVGYYNLRVNGDWASQWEGMKRPLLDPGWTTYEMTSLYNAYDITRQLVPSGPNAIALMLGNGWPDISPTPGNSSYESHVTPSPEELIQARLNGPKPFTENNGENREMRLIIKVRTSDGKTTTWSSTAPSFNRGDATSSDAPLGQWMCGSGALQYDNVYNGCTWDQTKYTTGWDLPKFDYSPGNWTSAVLRADPGGNHPTVMRPQAFPAVTFQDTFIPISINSPAPGVYVFDLGQNFAGHVRLSLPAPVAAGITIQMRHAELLQHPPYGPKDGNIYVGNLRSARATDLYTTGGVSEGFEIFEPVFTYHGFRFVEVTGLPFAPTVDTILGIHIRTGVEHAGNVVAPSGASALNQLQHAVTWGLGNNFMSVVSDCPQRDERKGWMGDSGLSLSPTHYNYAVGAFYTAWANNIRDSQMYQGDSHPQGSVPDTVPHTFGSYPSDPAWGTAYPGIVYSTWRMLGDTQIAIDHYPNLQLYISFMMSKCNSTGIKRLYQSYGDWCPPPMELGTGQGPKPPTSYTSGVAFLIDLQRMVELATALGKNSDAAMYKSYRDAQIADFNAAWLLAGGIYGNANGDGLQTANAAALFLGAADAAGVASQVQGALVNDIVKTHGNHWFTGIIGMRFLHNVLTAYGNPNVAIDTLLQPDYPSFGWWFNHPDEPATTMNELPDMSAEGPGMNSRNHHMFASVGGWLYEDLAGIGQIRITDSTYSPTDITQVGFKHAVIFPRATFHPDVGFAQGEYASISGQFAVSWINPNSSAASGGTCAANAPENSPVTFSCPSGATFTDVIFASFGTPSGSCGSFQVGSCNAANSTSIVRNACIGKSTCTISVSDVTFGDPCFNTVKVFDAQLQCNDNAGTQVSATIPTNAKATIRIPFLSSADLTKVSLSEAGTVFYTNGAFVNGAVPGITAASAGKNDLPVGTTTIDVEVGSGSYVISSAL